MDLILGAGCAGLGLAEALVDAGVDTPITLVDRRETYSADRTWCFWQTDDDGAHAAAASHRWHRWRFIGRDGAVVEHGSSRHPYLRVDAADFYAGALRRLRATPNVDLRLGTRVQSVTPLGGGGQVRVETSGGALVASRVYDAMGGAGPLGERAPAAIELRQSFLGLEIETVDPAFDPQVATLMDFRCGPTGTGDLHFMYVLPTSPTRALVEHTTLGPGLVAPAVRRFAIGEYLARYWAVDRFDTVREERGVLPMTSHAFPMSPAPGVLAVGAAAGGIRPSSGYAFVRIARHARAVAAAVATEAAPPRRAGLQRHATLDLLFLRALAAAPATFDRTLLALASGTSGDRFARFMSDSSTLADEAAVMRSLARPRFLVPMAASSLLRPIAPADRAGGVR